MSTEPILDPSVPMACTLPTSEQPLRVAEFDELFRTAVHAEHRVDLRPRGGGTSCRAGGARERLLFVLHLYLDCRQRPVVAPGERSGSTHGRAGRSRRPCRSGGAPVSAALRSGQVARAAGVNPQTLRFYERRGLLERPPRSFGGHRLYPTGTVRLLRMIKTAQRLGFSLDEVADLLATLGAEPARRPAASLQDRARTKLAEVEAQIADLATIRDTLVRAVAAGCDDLARCADTPTCPLPFPDAADADDFVR
jgi:DNA-binding transcriptional MerR regulator